MVVIGDGALKVAKSDSASAFALANVVLSQSSNSIGANPSKLPRPPATMAGMTVEKAFKTFAKRVMQPARAARYTSLLATAKGKRRILASLDHALEMAILPNAIGSQDYSSVLDKPCFVFHSPRPFGDSASSVRQALSELSLTDGWLILVNDGSAAVLRPEGRWDAERLIAATLS